MLAGARIQNVVTGEVKDVPLNGIFFAIGHEPATKFLNGQLELDEDGYIVTKPGHTTTNIPGVFAAGDVQVSTVDCNAQSCQLSSGQLAATRRACILPASCLHPA